MTTFAIALLSWLLFAGFVVTTLRNKNRIIARLLHSNNELLKSFGHRENELLSELNWHKQDANRLAAIVAEYLEDIDKTSGLLKDPCPPQLLDERQALSNHRNPPDFTAPKII